METFIFNILHAAYEQTYSHLYYIFQQGMEFYPGQHPHAHIELLGGFFLFHSSGLPSPISLRMQSDQLNFTFMWQGSPAAIMMSQFGHSWHI